MTQPDEAQIAAQSQWIGKLRTEIARVIVGQSDLLDGLLTALLCNGHVLLEGVPGLAKTLTIRTLATCIRTGFQRIQFTPDLLPADLIGTMIYQQNTGTFAAKLGPIFSNLILADEINRAPAKVQSALLEAMQERQVTIGDQSYKLPEPFLVLATQNPIEQEGTYPLPEAQLDRFLFKLKVAYPDRQEEKTILERMGTSTPDLSVSAVADPADMLACRVTVNNIYIDGRVRDYIVDVVRATRSPQEHGLDLKELIRFGASPRATIALALAARARAFLAGRAFVTPADVKAVGHDVLRHRILLSYEAEAEEITTDQIIDRIFSKLPVP